jgi:CubicO group peptidase (beta-lactamase class C family)
MQHALLAGEIESGDHDFGDVTARLETAIRDEGFKGAGLLITRDGVTLYKRAFGADTVTTAHLLGSATKLASATTVMTLVDSGHLTLGDPIARFLPFFPAAEGAVTVRELLSQTHGLPFGHPSIPNPLEDNGITLAESVEQIARDCRLLYPPGSKHHYQPAASFHILGRIAEVVTGQPWAVLFEERVAGPLAMRTFTYGDTPNPRIGGGAECALQDYANMLEMHLAGGVFRDRRVLSAWAVAEMQRDQLHGVPFTPTANHRARSYGLAWWHDTLDASGEPVVISVPGVFGAIPWLDRRLGYGGFLLIRRHVAKSMPLLQDLLPLIEPAIAE